jgi:hypothetical protein
MRLLRAHFYEFSRNLGPPGEKPSAQVETPTIELPGQNPLIHLRLGQLYHEGGKLEKAADELARAYMGAGGDIFIREDPKYFEFLKTKIII